jgi:hypothetical protein
MASRAVYTLLDIKAVNTFLFCFQEQDRSEDPASKSTPAAATPATQRE